MLNRWPNKYFFFGLLILILGGVPAACQSIENYQDPNIPLFAGNYAGTPASFDGTLKVITWNIKFSDAIETAIAELSDIEELQDADIILLQEMEENGVETMAQALHYNYVYFPASIHSHHGKNFGNAVLSKWPISNSKKLILPHQNPKNNQMRIATQAIVTVNDIQISTYSVHTETVWLSPGKRDEQILALVEDMGEMSQFIIAGGDFNTVTPQSIAHLDKRLARIGLARISADAGHTFERGGLDFTMDHIYAKGMTVLENGVWQETRASDHYPVWAVLAVKRWY